MAQFSDALNFTLNFEDRNRTYSENIDNNGGRVIAGINSKSFPQDEAAIAALPQSQRAAAVSFFYYSKFWTPLQAGGLESQDVANRYFDCSVDCLDTGSHRNAPEGHQRLARGHGGGR